MEQTFRRINTVELDSVTLGYGSRVLMAEASVGFGWGELTALIGRNGTGKSTFVKMLLGEVRPDSGRFVVGETVRFGYFCQDGIKFDEQMKVIDAVRKIADYIDLGGGKHLSAMQFLQHFMFTPQQQQSYIYKLSGGEKSRLHLCTILMQNPNFLILDEPTNDLDIVTLQVLEQYLQDFHGCVIVISHDRYFMDKVVDHLLVFKGEGNVKDFPGNYTQFREWEKLLPNPTSESKESKPQAGNMDNRPKRHEQKRKMTFKEKKEFEQLETEISSLEAEKAEIENALCSGTLSVEKITELSKRLPVIEEELDEKSMRWLELSEIES